MTPLLFTLALTVPPPGSVAPSADFPPAVQWAAVTACVRVSATTTPNGWASGFVVNVDTRDGTAYVLTAAHAVPPGESCVVHTFSRESYPARDRVYSGAAVTVAVRLADPDVALLKVNVGNGEAAALPHLRLAKPGQRPKAFPVPVLAVGCDDGNAPRATPDTLRAKRVVIENHLIRAFFWETAGESVDGRSGGPLLTTDGAVIGVASAKRAGYGYYAHLDEILAGLKKSGYAWLWAGK